MCQCKLWSIYTLHGHCVFVLVAIPCVSLMELWFCTVRYNTITIYEVRNTHRGPYICLNPEGGGRNDGQGKCIRLTGVFFF